jgi:multidrug efflux pump subunit AcrA (membrane-fusion protein)
LRTGGIAKGMNTITESTNAARRKITGKAAISFFAVMLLLTFFSNTINNFTLPKVTYETPAGGALIKEITGTGKVEAKITRDKYVTTSMKVTGVMVSVGDSVKQGQRLLTLDTSDVENQLKDEQDRNAQKKLYLAKLMEACSPGNLLSLDKAVQTARQNLDKARRDYDSNKALYEAGAVSRNELEDSKMNLDNAVKDYDIAKNNRNSNIWCCSK